MLWKIGNGENIKVGTDAWIPNLFNGRITPNINTDPRLRVKDIMLLPKVWDYDKIENLFLPYEIEVIKRIPFRDNGLQDTRYWKYEK